MRVLGIESSCDETAAAVVTESGEVLSDVVASQFAVHAPFGGVVPELASRAHLRNVIPVLEAAVREAGGLETIDAIAVTNGPGLVGALLVGVQAAKALAFSRGLPLVGVDHLVAHLLAVHVHRPGVAHVEVPFPYVALLASGGHTALYVVRSPVEHELLGQTRDDAAGEAFDKVAKLLGLGHPGGPAVDRLAALGDPRAIELPLAMAQRASLEMSFSGLKTAVAHHLEKHGAPQTEQALADLCASFQRAVVTALVRKSVRACEVTGLSHLVLAGGVAANRGLRALAVEQGARHGLTVHVPPIANCTDNAAMIAYTGARRLALGLRDGLDVPVYSRSPDKKRGKFPARPLKPV